MRAFEIAFWVLSATVVYVYAGYPLLLVCLRAVLKRKPVRTGAVEPDVTLVISAYNEAAVIEGKIRNSLELDYPRDRLDVLVVSDASDDGTDEIVAGFAERGVRLIRMPERGGKTLGLNEAVKQARGEIVVFSDANALYRRDAIRMLVRNFADPAVGAAVGESTYSPATNDSEQSESSYWRYETAIKRLESELGSVVGGDGAIYAIRKSCYRPMPADALSDFVNPLQIVEQGYRCVYEPAAVSVEEAAGSFDKEFRRKVRIVNRAWRAMVRLKHLLNPFRYGVFSLQLLSHKVLRWLVPVFLLALLAVNVAVARTHVLYAAALGLQAAFYLLAATGYLLRRSARLPFFVSIPFYFCLVNFASLRGVVEAYRGKLYTTWTPARTD
ncbi:MAG TPA: glycosyltransferase family 2 protein [Gammaproteobacteria bacterium]